MTYFFYFRALLNTMKKLPVIVLQDKYHRDLSIIFIKFSYNQKLVDAVKSLDCSRWSNTNKAWYVLNSKKNLQNIYTVFKDIAIVNSEKLSHKTKHLNKLSEDQKKILNEFYIYLKGKRYSQSTIKTYTFFIADFICLNSEKEVTELKSRDVEIYIEQVFIERKYSISTQRQFIGAAKLFFKFYSKSDVDGLELNRPKKDKKLPNVLSQEEVIRLIQVTKNIKHRAIIALLYSSGLRIGELINLQLRNIDVNRKQLIIKNAKGRKDRFVMLAESFIPLLRNYIITYQPKFYFVENTQAKQYSQSSVRKFLAKNCKLASIHKSVTPHTLRHSYATHLLENGVGLRHIQELLGHVKPETTMIYTHVAKKDLLEIQSPLDKIILDLNKNTDQEKQFLLSGK